MVRQYLDLLGVFAAMAATVAIAEQLWPDTPTRQPINRPGLRTDLTYWVVTPIIERVLARLFFWAIMLLPLLYGVDLATLAKGRGPLALQPFWLQAVECFVVGDLVAYWHHRLSHMRWLWGFHAVHHSPTHLDWLATLRRHPVDAVISRLCLTVPLLLMGFDMRAYAPYVLAVGVQVFVMHSNFRWRYGALGHLLVSPAFHRWHHTSADEGRDRNFGGIFTFWDRLFGTYYMPADRSASAFGVEDQLPRGFAGQMLQPVFQPLLGARWHALAGAVRRAPGRARMTASRPRHEPPASPR